MGLKLALSIGPVIAAIATAAFLKSVGASPEIVIVALALVVAISGTAIGVFWEVPAESKWVKSSPRSSRRP
jgi:hypothetical protein